MLRTRHFKHPKKGFSGRVNGIEFVGGVAEVTGKAQVFWLERHGFRPVDAPAAEDPTPTEDDASDQAAT